jgi:hypothetical protein
MSRRASPKHKRKAWWRERLFDFVCGFLLGIVLWVFGSAWGSYGLSSSLAHMAVMSLFCGALATVFGRRFWRFVRWPHSGKDFWGR